MKKILATGGMLAYMLWFNTAGSVSAAAMPEIAVTDIQNPKYYQSVKHSKYAEDRILRLADKFGIDHAVLERDIASGMPTKEIAKKHGITLKQFRELHKKYK